MSLWALLAPGPSATAEQAAKVHAAGIPLGAIGNAFELAPFAAFIASSDAAWWRRYPDAQARECRKFGMHEGPGFERVKDFGLGIVNSGVLGLQCVAREFGASKVLLLGFDMHGTHFFGAYTNGLRNTAPHQRQSHLQQYARWALRNPKVEVINCTPGSALTAFPRSSLDACLA